MIWWWGCAAPPPPAFPTLGDLARGCEARTEGSSSAGECSSDADCAKAGCSGEVCVSAARAPEVLTTCGVLPCFAQLDTCGCHGGVCSWTRKP